MVHYAVSALWRAGYEAHPLDSSCCGMAGSFGYGAEIYEIYHAIGAVSYNQSVEFDSNRVVAPGVSCSKQFHDCTVADGDRPPPLSRCSLKHFLANVS